MNARDALRALMLADEPLADFGGRVYPRWVPQGCTPPYATLTKISEVPEHGLKGAATIIKTRVQIDVFAADLPTAERLALRIRTLLDGFVGTVTAAGETLKLTLCQWQQEDGDFDRTNEFGDSGYERVSLDFLVGTSA